MPGPRSATTTSGPPSPLCTATPVIASDTLPCLEGKGSRNYSCPGCRRLLLAGIEFNQIRAHTVFRCPHCGSYSRMPMGR
jgi:DNA-directed RNA polymerase subunit RPC12/RpoP